MNANLPRLAFAHIPRTGGTTLGTILESAYAGRKIQRFYGEDETGLASGGVERFMQLDIKEKISFSLLRGHFVYGFDQSLTDFRYITLLRDPCERLISYYYYVMRDPKNYLHALVVQRRLKLEEFLVSDMTAELDNLQVRFVAGDVLQRERVGEEHLKRAKINLRQKFWMFGILESFEQSILKLSRMLRVVLPVVPARNTSERIDGRRCSDRCLKIIQEKNRFDIELYRFGKDIFDRAANEG